MSRIITSKLLLTFANGYRTKNPETPEPKIVRHDILSRDRSLDIAVDKSKEVIQSHKEYDTGTIKLPGLAKFDQTADYGLSDATEDELRYAEVVRLRDAMEGDGSTCLLFNSNGAFGSTNEGGLRDLSNVADQVLCNFAIIALDNSLLAFRYSPNRYDKAVALFSSSRRILVARFRNDGVGTTNGNQPKTMKSSAGNKRAYFALVDFISACIVRFLSRCAWSEKHYWGKNVLGILACLVVKLKVLYYDPTGNAQISLSTGAHEIKTIITESKFQQDLVLVLIGKDSEDSTKVSTSSVDIDVTTQYYDEHIMFRHYLEKLFMNVLFSFFSAEKSGEGAACFELCNTIYETGLDKSLTVVAMDRDGDITASSESSVVKYSLTALELLHLNTAQLFLADRPGKSALDRNVAVEVQCQWPGSTIPDKPCAHHTSSLDDLVSLLVPLSLASAWTGTMVDELVHLASSGTDGNDPILQFAFPKQDEYQARYSIKTNSFIAQEARNPRHLRDPHVTGLAQAPLLIGFHGLHPVGLGWAGVGNSYISTVRSVLRIRLLLVADRCVAFQLAKPLLEDDPRPWVNMRRHP